MKIFLKLASLAILCANSSILAGDYTWSQYSPKAGQSVWTSVDISSDGSTLASSAWNDYVYTSANGGAAWVKRSPAGTAAKGWNGLGMSDDGTKIAACAWNDYLYYSADGGATWSKKSPAGAVKGFNSVSVSGDGTIIAVCAWNDFLYYSADSGATWSKKSPAGTSPMGWSSVAISNDGTQIAASAYNDYVYCSVDSGATWSKKSPAGTNKGWSSVDMSGDGTVIAAAAVNDYVYTSKNSGGAWEKNSPSGGTSGMNWQSVSLTSTGTRIAAGVQGAYVFAGTSSTLGWSVTFQAGIGGTIAGSASQTVLNGGDCLPVTAVPNPGFSFVDWTGSVSSTDNPLTVAGVSKDMNIVANFAADGDGNKNVAMPRLRFNSFRTEEQDENLEIRVNGGFRIVSEFQLDAFHPDMLTENSKINFKLGAWDSGVITIGEARLSRKSRNGCSLKFVCDGGKSPGHSKRTIAIRCTKNGKLQIHVAQSQILVKEDNSDDIIDLAGYPDSKSLSGVLENCRMTFAEFIFNSKGGDPISFKGRKSTRAGFLGSWSVSGRKE